MARSISHILGRTTTDTLWTLPPGDAVSVCRAIRQDAVPCSLTWSAPNGSVLSAKDLEKLSPPDPRSAAEKIQQYLDATAGTGVGVCARISGPLCLSYMTTGPVPIESFMYLLYDEPATVERLLDLYLDYHLRVIDAIRALPFHLFYIGDDVSSTRGLILSPELTERLWAPRCGRLVTAAVETGRPVIFHCCGKVSPILNYLADWGVSAVHPLQPGANDIYAIAREWGKRLALVGNIDVAGVLSFGTPDDVWKDTIEHIEHLAGVTGYVVCSSHSIIDTVPPENFLAMTHAARDYAF